jgi:tetratricopeptide (TPR) repeat protein
VQEGRPTEALPFFEEALRLRPGWGAFLYARANAFADLSQLARATEDYEAALRDLPQADGDRVRLALALVKLARGDLGGGWDDYRARLSRHSAKPVVFSTDAKPWPFDPDEAPDALQGRRLALFAEQGLGDEVMFATIPRWLMASDGARRRRRSLSTYGRRSPRPCGAFDGGFPSSLRARF